MSLRQRLDHYARVEPEKVAIDSEAGQLSYHQLSVLTDQCINYFINTGLKRGDRVAILALNHPDWFITLFAAASTGLVLVPLNWRLAIEELSYVIEDSVPALILHDAMFADTAVKLQGQHKGVELQEFGTGDFPPTSSVAAAAQSGIVQAGVEHTDIDRSVSSSETDPLLIVYTSGTTGRPKGAVLSQKALLCSASMSQHMLDLSISDRVLNVLPLFHVGGLNIQPLPTLLYGATLFSHSRFDPDLANASLEKDLITLINTVPTMLTAMLDSDSWAKSDKSSLRAISIGSTDVPVSLIQRIQANGIPLIQIYGATETSPVAIYQRIEDAEVTGSIGRAGSNCDIRLTDKNGNPVATGETGQIEVRGDNVLSHYWKNKEATQSSLCDGWFKTGDMAHQDEKGFYWFDDRLKHVIISGGENIYPAELERLILLVPGVEEVSVVGQPDDRWGEVPVAVVAGSADSQAVLDACSQLARFKRPKHVYFVDALPRNALGKIQVQEVKSKVMDTGAAVNSGLT